MESPGTSYVQTGKGRAQKGQASARPGHAATAFIGGTERFGFPAQIILAADQGGLDPVGRGQGLCAVVLVVQDWGGILGLTLPMEDAQRYRGLLVMNTTLATGEGAPSEGFLAWREMCARNPEFGVGRLLARGNPHLSTQECAAYDAPFPDRGHRAALRAFPPMVPDRPGADGAAVSRAAREFWRTRWSGTCLMAIGLQDPVLGRPVMDALRADIRGCPEPMLLPQAGHFVQEHGGAVAREAVLRFAGV